MKPTKMAWVFTVIGPLVLCGAAFAQHPQLSPGGLRGIRPGSTVPSSTFGAASMDHALGWSESPALSLTWGIYTFPGAVGSLTAGVTKSGEIVGGYGPNIDVSTNSNDGFLLKAGKFSTVSYPGSSWTQPNGISDTGEIVGSYGASATDEHGFTLKGTTYTSFDYPGAAGTFPFGINKTGNIVGEWTDTSGVYHGFLLSKKEKVFTSIDYPDAVFTFAGGINNTGEIGGWYLDSNYNFHGFLLQNGNFTTFDYPGYSNNYVADINDNGAIAGGYGETTVVNGITYYWESSYVFENGAFTTFDAPFGPAAVTQIWHLNDYGAITGIYADNSSTVYGFVATVGQ